MSHIAALPFAVQRRNDVLVRPGADANARTSVTSTEETVEGLLILEGDHLVVQWRVARKVQHVGAEIRSNTEIEPIQEVVLPLTGIARAKLRWKLRRWRRRWQVVVTAADLRTFEPLGGVGDLQLAHAGQMILDVRSADRDAAAEFVKELDYALAEDTLRRAEAIDVERPSGSAGIARPELPRPDERSQSMD